MLPRKRLALLTIIVLVLAMVSTVAAQNDFLYQDEFSQDPGFDDGFNDDYDNDFESEDTNSSNIIVWIIVLVILGLIFFGLTRSKK